MAAQGAAAAKAQDELQARMTARASELEGQLAAASKARDELQANLATRVLDLQGQIAAANKAKDDVQAALGAQVAELQKQVAAAHQSRSEVEARLAAQIGQLQAEAGAAKRTGEELQSKAAARIADLDGSLRDVRAELEQSRAKVLEAGKRITESSSESEQAKQDMVLAMRMQAIASSDLRDLQARYTKLMEIKEKQEALLRELTPRLRDVARYLSTSGSPEPKPNRRLSSARRKSEKLERL